VKCTKEVKLDAICPKCGNKTFVKEIEIHTIPNSYYEEYRETIKCKKCKHVVYACSGEILAV